MNLRCFMAFCGLCLVSLASEGSVDDVPMQLKCLWASYRNFKITPDNKSIILSDGQKLPFKSKVSSSAVDPNNLTSIDQMYYARYPYGFAKAPHGRLVYETPTKKDELRASRYGKLFQYLYGSSESVVNESLVTVQWVDGSNVVFNRRYGAARALRKAVYELYNLASEHPEIRQYLRRPIGGTFEWRRISHSKNLSMHAFATAIDINTRFSNYWRWEIGSDGIPHYRNSIPPSIAQVFENNGFIWGGKWYHYDTMHFEFRPELLMNHDDCERIFQSAYRN